MDLESVREKLRSSDSLMEADVLKTLRHFLVMKGEPREAVALLSATYRGWARMANLLGSWLSSQGGDPDATLVQLFSEEVEAAFDPKRADAIFSAASAPPGWAEGIVRHSEWHGLVHRLIRRYPQCLVLQFLREKLKAAEAKAPATSVSPSLKDAPPKPLAPSIAYAQTIAAIKDALSAVTRASRSEQTWRAFDLSQCVGRLADSASHSTLTYLVTQRCLLEASVSCPSRRMRIIARNLRKRVSAAVQTRLPNVALTGHHTAVWRRNTKSRLNAALAMVERSGKIEKLSAQDLHKFFAQRKRNAETHVQLLQQPVLAQLLAQQVTSSRGLGLGLGLGSSSDHHKFCTYLLAHASTSLGRPLGGGAPASEESVAAVITKVASMCRKCDAQPADFAADMARPGAFSSARDAVTGAPASGFVFVTWLSARIGKREFVKGSTFKAVPALLQLLVALADARPLLRPAAIACVRKALGCIQSGLGPVGERKLRRVVSRALVALVHAGGVCGKVFNIVTNAVVIPGGKPPDTATAALFMSELCASIAPPYSERFVQEFSEKLILRLKSKGKLGAVCSRLSELARGPSARNAAGAAAVFRFAKHVVARTTPVPREGSAETGQVLRLSEAAKAAIRQLVGK